MVTCWIRSANQIFPPGVGNNYVGMMCEGAVAVAPIRGNPSRGVVLEAVQQRAARLPLLTGCI